MRASLFGALLVISACSASAPAQRPVKAPQPVIAQASPLADTCPLALDGASLEVKDHEFGIALEFTSYDDVAELRRRVRLIADIRHADTNHRILEDVDGGARIVFPDEYRSQIVEIGKQIDAGACVAALPTKPDEQIIVSR